MASPSLAEKPSTKGGSPDFSTSLLEEELTLGVSRDGGKLAQESGPLSDTDYLAQHKIPELFDMLIYQVAMVKPKHPAAYMAYLMRQRIEARDGKLEEEVTERVETVPLPTQQSSTVKKQESLLEPSNSESTMGDTSFLTTGTQFQKFGIWLHVQNSDIPMIIARFHEQCTDNDVDPPKDFTTNTAELLRILSRATCIYFFNGFSEARKIIPLQPHKNAPVSCTYLCNAVTDVITIATMSQRRSFETFMNCMRDNLRVDDVDEIRETSRIWRNLRSSPTFKTQFFDRMKLYARQFDLLMDFESYWDTFFKWVDTYIDTREMAAAERQEMMRSTYNTIKAESAFPRLPDRFGFFVALLLCVLRDCPEEVKISEKARVAITNVLHALIEDENAIAVAKTAVRRDRDGAAPRIRRCDPAVVSVLSRVFHNGFEKKFADEHGSSRMTLDYYFRMRDAYTDDCSDAFVQVSSAALKMDVKYAESETHAMRCNAYSRLKLLEILVEMVVRRSELTMSEIELYLLRTRCCGVVIGTFMVYMCDVYRLTGMHEQLIEKAKIVLGYLQEVCISANNSPVISEFGVSFHLLAESTERLDAFVEAFTPAPPFADLPGSLLVDFFDIPSMVATFSACYDRQAGEGFECYFNLCHLMVTRMQVARIENTVSFNFLPFALLAAVNTIAEKVPLYSLLPACEVFIGFIPSLDMPCHFGLSAADRLLLNTFFHTHRTDRALVKAVHYFLEVFPELRRRVTRPSISYQRVQRYFYSAVHELLTNESKEDCSKLLRLMAIDLAVEGMLPRDYDLFSLCLTTALRVPGFPEAPWNVFMLQCAEEMKSFTPILPPLKAYQRDLDKIVKVQRCARRFIRLRAVGMSTQDRERLNQLMDELSTEPVEEDDIDDIRLSNAEAELVALTWKILDPNIKAHAIYNGVRTVQSDDPTRPASASPYGHRTRSGSILSMNSMTSGLSSNYTNKYEIQRSSREETRTIFKKCKGVAETMTKFINIVCKDNKGRNWETLWDKWFDRDFQTFFDDLIGPQDFMVFAMPFIETIKKQHVFKHSAMRVIWAAFASCFNRMILADVGQQSY